MQYLKISLAVLLLITVACNTSRITTSWKDQVTDASQHSKILVLGFIKDNDRALQEKMENHFVGDLNDLGYNSISSLKEYGPKAFNNVDESTVVNALQNSSTDAVLTIVLLTKEKENKYIYNKPRLFWDYSREYYSRIYAEGYYVTNTRYYWESNFYDVKTQKLLYSVQTTSFEPSDKEAMAHEYGKMIVKNMLKQKILLTKNKI